MLLVVGKIPFCGDSAERYLSGFAIFTRQLLLLAFALTTFISGLPPVIVEQIRRWVIELLHRDNLIWKLDSFLLSEPSSRKRVPVVKVPPRVIPFTSLFLFRYPFAI